MEETTKKEEISNQDILEAIQLFSHNVDGQFGEVNKQFGEVNKQFGEVKNEFKRLETKMDNGFVNLRTELETKMDDGFSSLSAEITEVKNDLLDRINKLDNTTKQDTDVIVRDYLDIKIRVKKLEQQVQQLQPA